MTELRVPTLDESLLNLARRDLQFKNARIAAESMGGGFDTKLFDVYREATRERDSAVLQVLLAYSSKLLSEGKSIKELSI